MVMRERAGFLRHAGGPGCTIEPDAFQGTTVLSEGDVEAEA